MRQQITPKNIMIFILIGLIAGLMSGCKSEQVPPLSGEKDYNLLVITLDTTRSDRLGCYGFQGAETPNLDKLARTGVLFKNAYCSAPLTLPSHCTIFTGRQPLAHNVRNNGTYLLNDQETTLAEVMASKGYSTHAVIAAFVLISKFGLNQGFMDYDDTLSLAREVNNLQTQIRADKVYEKFQRWFENHHQEKFFSWVHFYDPHHPYDPPGDYGTRFKNDPYSGELAYVDFYIGKILDDLQAKQILDKTLIVVVGDHGEAFGEHKEVGHGIFCYEESLKVPLIFSNPKIWEEPYQVSRRFNLLDLMPTILQLYRFPIPSGVQGKSMAHLLIRDEVKPELNPPQYFESMFAQEDMNWAPLTGIIVDQHKYISLPEPELYDLVKDPGETENLFKKENRLAKKLDNDLRQYILSHAQKGDAKRQLTGTDQQQLRSLGYISTMSGSSHSMMDPKKGIILVNTLINCKTQIDKGQTSEAESTLLKMVTENPGTLTPPLAYEYFHDIYKARGDNAAAEKALKDGLALFPNTSWLELKLANFYVAMKREKEAESVCLELLKKNSAYNQANILLARIYAQMGQKDLQLSACKRALDVEPSNTVLQIDYAELLIEKGQLEDARKIVNRVLENPLLIKDAGNILVKKRLGTLLTKLGEFEKSIALTQTLPESELNSPAILNQIGMAHYRKGNLQEALAAYEKALPMDSSNPLTLSNLGTLYLTIASKNKDKEALVKAVEFLQKAEQIDPKILAVLNGLAVASSFSGDRNKAVSYWERAIAVNPDFIDVYFNLGITYIEMKKMDKALLYLNRCKQRFEGKLNSDQIKQLNSLILEAQRSK